MIKILHFKNEKWNHNRAEMLIKLWKRIKIEIPNAYSTIADICKLLLKDANEQIKIIQKEKDLSKKSDYFKKALLDIRIAGFYNPISTFDFLKDYIHKELYSGEISILESFLINRLIMAGGSYVDMALFLRKENHFNEEYAIALKQGWTDDYFLKLWLKEQNIYYHDSLNKPANMYRFYYLSYIEDKLNDSMLKVLNEGCCKNPIYPNELITLSLRGAWGNSIVESYRDNAINYILNILRLIVFLKSFPNDALVNISPGWKHRLRIIIKNVELHFQSLKDCDKEGFKEIMADIKEFFSIFFE